MQIVSVHPLGDEAIILMPDKNLRRMTVLGLPARSAGFREFGTKALSYPAKPPHFRIMEPRRFRLDLLPEFLTCPQDFLLVHCHKPVVVNDKFPVQITVRALRSVALKMNLLARLKRVVGIHS